MKRIPLTAGQLALIAALTFAQVAPLLSNNISEHMKEELFERAQSTTLSHGAFFEEGNIGWQIKVDWFPSSSEAEIIRAMVSVLELKPDEPLVALDYTIRAIIQILEVEPRIHVKIGEETLRYEKNPFKMGTFGVIYTEEGKGQTDFVDLTALHNQVNTGKVVNAENELTRAAGLLDRLQYHIIKESGLIVQDGYHTSALGGTVVEEIDTNFTYEDFLGGDHTNGIGSIIAQFFDVDSQDSQKNALRYQLSFV